MKLTLISLISKYLESQHLVIFHYLWHTYGFAFCFWLRLLAIRLRIWPLYLQFLRIVFGSGVDFRSCFEEVWLFLPEGLGPLFDGSQLAFLIRRQRLSMPRLDLRPHRGKLVIISNLVLISSWHIESQLRP